MRGSVMVSITDVVLKAVSRVTLLFHDTVTRHEISGDNTIFYSRGVCIRLTSMV